MVRSVHTTAYKRLRSLLTTTRLSAGLTQAALSAKLRKTQSFVSKYESGERRLDMIEFLEVCKALGADPIVIVESMRHETAIEQASTLGNPKK